MFKTYKKNSCFSSCYNNFEWIIIFCIILVALPSFSLDNDSDEIRQVIFRFQPVISGNVDVFVVGTFNDWNEYANPLTDSDQDGVYETEILLAPGRYEYKFVVNGNWKTDFNADEIMGIGHEGDNSVIIVDDRYKKINFFIGDGKISHKGINLKIGYRMLDPHENGSIRVTVPAYKHDVDRVELIYRTDSNSVVKQEMQVAATGAIFDYFQTCIQLTGLEKMRFCFHYCDSSVSLYAGSEGFSDGKLDINNWFVYNPDELPPFKTPDWVKHGIFYQIFPDRFRNGDTFNDPDFSETYYKGKQTLPPEGKTNKPYFHMEEWNDIAGLTESPYRTDGKPDYYSFYGGDIKGVMEKLNYLKELGITILYFNPLNKAKSNHKYDPVDYMTIDPHFADEELFKQFVNKAHKKGIRIIVDKAFNHTGDEHFAFVDTKKKGEKSPYWLWYEWHKWPLPSRGAPTPCDYYDCWWGFPLHPNLNFDLSRLNKDENMIRDISKAEPNWDVVNYLLNVAHYWIEDLNIDGFRLDVPNEVPFWFWKKFRETALSIDPDSYLIGEIWGNALPWLGEYGFHATMNYKYFRDPVLDFFARQNIDALSFDEALAPGRVIYPGEAVLAMMNLIDSHDTVRFLTQAENDIRRLKLAALFQMTYVGVPQVYYGDEVALQGGKDPDNRRPFPWNWEYKSERREVHDFYQKLMNIRHKYNSLRTGSYKTLYAKNQQLVFSRIRGNQKMIIVINNSKLESEIKLSKKIRQKLGKYVWMNLMNNQNYDFRESSPAFTLEPYQGLILINHRQ
ncbi:MAG: alpha amylase N-terminal ig-like domain-containing protein [bacterium]